MKKFLEYILLGLGYGIWLIFSLVMFFEASDSLVPFWNLSEDVTYLLLLLIWPLIASFILGLIGKMVLSKIYLWIFQKLHKNIQIGYVKPVNPEISLKKTLIRLFNVFLVTVGLVNALLSAQIIIPNNFLTESQLTDYLLASIIPKYTPKVLSQILGLIIPVSVGLWSIVWSLEDMGLVQYQIRNLQEGNRFSELQPLFKDFSSYISGYGGISSIIFYSGYFIYFFTEYNQLGGNFGDLILFLFLIFSFLAITPAFLLLNKITPNYLLKDLSESPEIQIFDA